MTDEPTSRIEAELKAYAEQRRAEAGPPFALDPVNRRLLQEEVARAFRRTEAPPPSDRAWIKWLWPRLALAGALSALGVFAVLKLTPSRPEPEYEMARTAAPIEQKTAPVPAPVAAPAPTPAPEAPAEADRADRLLSTTRSVAPARARPESRPAPGPAPEQAMLKEGPAAAAPAASAARAPADASSAEPMRRRYGLRQAPAPPSAQGRTTPDAGGVARLDESAAALGSQRGIATEPAPDAPSAPRGTEPMPTGTLSAPTGTVPPPAVGALAQRGATDVKAGSDAPAFVTADPSRPAQRFVHVDTYRRNFNSPPLPPVLQSFHLRQNGLEVEIEDTDGSVYRGTLGQAEAQPVALRQAARRGAMDFAMRAQGADNAPGRGESPWRFLATGTNLSLNQRVVFAGEFILGTNPPAFGVPAANQAVLQEYAPTSPAAATTLQGAQRVLVPLAGIRGQAVVGEETRLEINALPTSP